jgi:hypothetical protein
MTLNSTQIKILLANLHRPFDRYKINLKTLKIHYHEKNYLKYNIRHLGNFG